MKYKMKIAILSFFTLFLSLLNLKNGLIFNVTDNTERDALFSNFEEKTDKKDKMKADIKSVNIPKAKTTTSYAVSSATTKKSSTPKNYNYANIKSTRINCNSSMPTTSNDIFYCNYMGSSAIFAYGHNSAKVFASLANLKQNDTFTIKIDGKVKKYRVINNFTLKLSTLNPPKNSSKKILSAASALRTKLYSSTYGGKYDITLQTCAGKGDTYRRYIQAVAV